MKILKNIKFWFENELDKIGKTFFMKRLIYGDGNYKPPHSMKLKLRK